MLTQRPAGRSVTAGTPGPPKTSTPVAYCDLSDPPGPDLAGCLAMWDPATRSDDDLIDRIGGWEKIVAWAQAGQLADIAELTDRRRHTDQLERAEHTARGGHGEPGQLMEFVVDEIALAARISPGRSQQPPRRTFPHPSRRATRDQRTADQRRADAVIDLATSYLDTHPALRPTTPGLSPYPPGYQGRTPRRQ